MTASNPGIEDHFAPLQRPRTLDGWGALTVPFKGYRVPDMWEKPRKQHTNYYYGDLQKGTPPFWGNPHIRSISL